MNQYLLTLVLLLSVTAWAAPQQLRETTYDSFMKSNQVVLVNLFRGACSECEYIHQELDKLEQMIGTRSIRIAKVNCSQDGEICEKLKIQRMPSYVLIAKNTPIEYNGQMTAEETYDWLLDMAVPNLEEIDQSTVKKIKKENFLLVSSLSEADLFLLSAASRLRTLGIPFFNIQSNETFIKLYLKDREEPVEYKTPINPFMFGYEVFHRARPAIMPLSRTQFSLYFNTQKDSEKILIFFDHDDEKGQQMNKVLSQYCMAEIVEVPCFSIKKGESDYTKYASRFKVNSTDSLMVILTESKKNVFFYQPQTPSYVFLEQFVKSAINGTAQATNEEQKISEQIKYEFVKQLDSRTYYSTVQNQPFLFVEYYSTNCPHCVQFIQEFQSVGKHFKDSQDVQVSALNVENQPKIADKAGIEGYPTFKLYVRGEVIDYTGERKAEAMIDFLMEFSKSRLLIAPKLSDVRTPAVVITGISERSSLHSLPALFQRYPIYLVTKDDKESIQIIDDVSTRTYNGKISLVKVADWLEDETTPILMSLGEHPPAKKLEKAMKNKKAILGLVNKGYQGSVDGALKVLEDFCKDVSNYVCGYVTKGEHDYEYLTSWIGDSETERNRLVWIDTKLLKVYLWDGKVEDLTEESVGEFVKKVVAGKWKEHQRPKKGKKQPETKSEVKAEVEQKQSANSEL